MLRIETIATGTVAVIALAVLLFAFRPWAFAQERDNPPPQKVNQPRASKLQQDTPVVESSEPEKIIDDAQLYMRAKLANSQSVLEGLVTEDFELIGKGAIQLKKIAAAAHWPKAIDEVYQHHSLSFRRQCDKLSEQADRGDLQAAHYTYLHMSTTCIDCHNYVRGRFRVEQKKKGGPVQLIPTRWDGPAKEKPKPPQPDDQDKLGKQLKLEVNKQIKLHGICHGLQTSPER